MEDYDSLAESFISDEFMFSNYDDELRNNFEDNLQTHYENSLGIESFDKEFFDENELEQFFVYKNDIDNVECLYLNNSNTSSDKKVPLKVETFPDLMSNITYDEMYEVIEPHLLSKINSGPLNKSVENINDSETETEDEVFQNTFECVDNKPDNEEITASVDVIDSLSLKRIVACIPVNKDEQQILNESIVSSTENKVNTCVVANCSSSTSTHDLMIPITKRFIHFKKWNKILDVNLDLQKYYICRQHFEPKYHTTHSIANSSIPSLNLSKYDIIDEFSKSLKTPDNAILNENNVLSFDKKTLVINLKRIKVKKNDVSSNLIFLNGKPEVKEEINSKNIQNYTNNIDYYDYESENSLYNKCIVKHCLSTRYNYYMFKLSIQFEHYKLWIKVLQIQPNRLEHPIYICAKHFERSFFLPDLSLKCDAMPTLDLMPKQNVSLLKNNLLRKYYENIEINSNIDDKLLKPSVTSSQLEFHKSKQLNLVKTNKDESEKVLNAEHPGGVIRLIPILVSNSSKIKSDKLNHTQIVSRNQKSVNKPLRTNPNLASKSFTFNSSEITLKKLTYTKETNNNDAICNVITDESSSINKQIKKIISKSNNIAHKNETSVEKHAEENVIPNYKIMNTISVYRKKSNINTNQKSILLSNFKNTQSKTTHIEMQPESSNISNKSVNDSKKLVVNSTINTNIPHDKCANHTEHIPKSDVINNQVVKKLFVVKTYQDVKKSNNKLPTINNNSTSTDILCPKQSINSTKEFSTQKDCFPIKSNSKTPQSTPFKKSDLPIPHYSSSDDLITCNILNTSPTNNLKSKNNKRVGSAIETAVEYKRSLRTFTIIPKPLETVTSNSIETSKSLLGKFQQKVLNYTAITPKPDDSPTTFKTVIKLPNSELIRKVNYKIQQQNELQIKLNHEPNLINNSTALSNALVMQNKTNASVLPMPLPSFTSSNKSSVTKCIVASCCSTFPSLSKRMYTFSTKFRYYDQWIDVLNLTSERMKNKVLICEIHFEKSFLLQNGISYKAVPTLNLDCDLSYYVEEEVQQRRCSGDVIRLNPDNTYTF